MDNAFYIAIGDKTKSKVSIGRDYNELDREEFDKASLRWLFIQISLERALAISRKFKSNRYWVQIGYFAEDCPLIISFYNDATGEF